MRKPVDFDAIHKEIQKTPQVGPNDLIAWGGVFDADKLAGFLEAWDFWKTERVWKLWLWPHQFRLDLEPSLPEDLSELERGRLFGEAGDLEVRRDCGRFLWRFVGDPVSAAPPTQFGEVADYWAAPKHPKLRGYTRQALLWGKRQDKDRWHDDRVAWADLRYPGIPEGDRVEVKYLEYLDGGRVELVRLRGLAPHKPAKSGDQNGRRDN